jgi:methylmalonyl-CoA mutase cobalamin-binding domain/chain
MSSEIMEKLKHAIINGDEGAAQQYAKEAISQGISAKTLINEAIIPATDVVGEKYEKREFFVTDLLMTGEALKAAMNEIQPHLVPEERTEIGGKVVLATVEGDVHDIGKNLVATLLQGAGFEVEDIGVDVSASKHVDKALELNADIIAASALMTVTRDGQKKIVEELEKRGLRDRFKVLIGGAATNKAWAEEIRADGWARDAADAVKVAKQLLEVGKHG